MDMALALSDGTQSTAGILLLTLVAVESGGTFLLRLARGAQPATDFQRAFSRAGHAHAGVLVILALVCLILGDGVPMGGAVAFAAHNGIWLAAILMPAGFFFSSAGRGSQRPNAFIALVYLGAVSLALGLTALGVSLLSA